MSLRRLFFGVWLQSAALLYFFENNTGTRALLAASLVLPAASILCARTSAGRTRLLLSSPQACACGEVECTVCTSGLLPASLLKGNVTARNRLTGEVSVFPLCLSGFSPRASLSFGMSHCGAVEFTLTDTAVQDWFGLWRSHPLSCPPEYTVIMPRPFALSVSFLPAETPSPDGERWSDERPGSDPGETFAIREYVPGDPVRQIHWKLTQKSGVPMLREFGQPTAEEILLLLDLSGAADRMDPARIDAAAAALLSLSHALISQGSAHCVGWKEHSSGRLVLCSVQSAADCDAMEAQLLASASCGDSESVCACFYKWHCGRVYAHTVLCAVSLPDDFSLLCPQGHVTVLLPDGDTAHAQGGGASVIPFSLSDTDKAPVQVEL